MSFFAALTRRWNYSIENPGAGQLLYREGNREYIFPIYKDDGVWVLVGAPSRQRVYFFFSWHPCLEEFTDPVKFRILSRIESHLQATSAKVRIFSRTPEAEATFEFYPELHGDRSRALELLDAAGYAWLSHFDSMDLVHEEYGLEVCGIQNEADVQPISEILQSAFPHWHHHKYCLHPDGRGAGWTFTICMFASRPCSSHWLDGY